MSINSKATQLAHDQQMIAGIKKHSSTVSSWVIAGKTYTAQQALDILQARVDAALAVSPAKATYTSTVNAANTETANSKQFVAGLRKAIFIMFSAQVDILDDERNDPSLAAGRIRPDGNRALHCRPFCGERRRAHHRQ